MTQVQGVLGGLCAIQVNGSSADEQTTAVPGWSSAVRQRRAPTRRETPRTEPWALTCSGTVPPLTPSCIQPCSTSWTHRNTASW